MRGFFNGWVITLMFTAAIGYFAVRNWPTSETAPSTSTVAQAEHGKTDQDAAPASGHEATERSPATTGKHADKVQREPSEAADHDARMRVASGTSKGLRPITEPPQSLCQNVEYRGPEDGKITNDQWKKTMVQFHSAKKDLLGWLEEHKGMMPKEVFDHMEAEVRELRLQRPPTPDFPDLAFRGIGLWTRPAGERPIIKLGPGFGKLVEKQPARARFELSRLIAQTWAPCELQRSPVALHVPAGGTWGEMLSCLSVKDENACQPGSFSEAGWAVSSAIASIASPPGCTVPGFAEGAGSGCLDSLRASSRHPASVKEHHQ